MTVAGSEATRAIGRWVDGAGEFAIKAQDSELTYRTVPPRAWVHDVESGWIELDSGSPLGNPIDALLKPTTLTTVSEQGGTLNLRGTYPAAVFGLSGDPVSVDLMLAADGSVSATYRMDTAGGTAVSETRMTPVANLEPVVAPVG